MSREHGGVQTSREHGGVQVKSALRFDAALAALFGVAVFVAALPGLEAFQSAGAGPHVALAFAAFAPVMLAFATGRLLRARAPVSYVVSLAGLVMLLVVCGGFEPSATYRDLVEGPNRVVTETLPLGGGLAEAAALLVLVWAAGALAGELVARTPPGRDQARIVFAVPVVLFAVCYAMAVPAPHHDNAAGPVLLFVLAAAAVVRHQASLRRGGADAGTGALEASGGARRARRYRSFGTGLASAAVAAAVVWALVPEVPALAQHPAAVHRTPPTAVPVVTDPLDTLAQLRDSRARAPARTVMTVDLAGPSTGYLAMAVLDSYDGGLWRFEGTFVPTGGRIPGPPPGPLTGAPVTQRVTEQEALPVPLLPALDRPRAVSGLAVVTDPATGMLLPQHSTDRAVSYTVVSGPPAATLAGVPAADGVGASPDKDDVAIPPDTATDLATTARFLAGLTGRRPAPTVSFLQAASAALHSHERRLDPALAASSAAGHLGGTSLSEVINAVTVNRAATPEQFATFFAMVARYLGVPARVVSGFRIAPTSGATVVRPGRYQVTNRDAWAWVEVPVAGVGWVVADPTPDRVTGVAAPPPEAVQAPATTLPPRQANAVPRSDILGGHALAPPARIKVPRSHHTPAWVLAAWACGLAVLALLLAGPVQAGARRWLRRRARRSADPAELAVGAWLELLDGLGRAGLRPDPGSTCSQVAEEAAGCFGPDLHQPVAGVGSVAEQAVFSPSRPPEHRAALEAWETQRSVCRRLRREQSPRDRVRASVLVGSTPRRPVGGE